MNNPSDNDIASAREYFGKRSERYALSLRSYPLARVLDLIPYCYFLRDAADRLGKKISELRVLDAFGGTGYLSFALRHSGIQFTVADCCPEMLNLGRNHGSRVRWRETTNYFSRLADSEPDCYDVVLCHGGLHHVIAENGGKVDHSLARQRQALTIENFSRLLAQNGTCIISDIPDSPPTKQFSGSDSQALSYSILKEILGRDQIDEITSLRIKPASFSLAHLADAIRHRFSTPITHPVPRYFFDHFVSKETPLGHNASFIPLQDLDEIAQSASFVLHSRLDYRGPWLFPTQRAAAWFFREKFAFAESTPIGEDQESEDFVAKRISEQLGSKSIDYDLFAVNWGVVYSSFVKL